MRTGTVLLAAAVLLAGCGWFGDADEPERPVGAGPWAVESPPETVEEAHALAEELTVATVDHLGFDGVQDDPIGPGMCTGPDVTADTLFDVEVGRDFSGVDPDPEAVEQLLGDAEAYWESQGVTDLRRVREGTRIPALRGRFEPLGQVSLLVNRDHGMGFVTIFTGCWVSENWEDYHTGGGPRPPSELDAEHADLFGDPPAVVGGDNVGDADPEEPHRDP